MRVEADLRRRLEAGEWASGEALPSVAGLASHYGVARGTVAKALRRLADAISDLWGGFEELKTAINDNGVKRFGSGWTWLVHDGTGLATEQDGGAAVLAREVVVHLAGAEHHAPHLLGRKVRARIVEHHPEPAAGEVRQPRCRGRRAPAGSC